MSSALLSAKGLTVETGLAHGQRLKVLSDVSFDLEPGKVLGLVGESGAGKSMIGRTIAQLLPPGFAVSAGSLSFAGEDLVAMEEGRRRRLLGREIAFIPQEPLSALNPVSTVGAQFGEHLARIGVAAAGRRDRIRTMLEAVHLQ